MPCPVHRRPSPFAARPAAPLMIAALCGSAALAAPPAQSASAGYHLFMTGSCASCHAIRGTPAAGRVGPDLTHLASRQRLAAGLLPNTPANLARWLRDPQALKPGCLMPNLYLKDDQVRALVAFLERLK